MFLAGLPVGAQEPIDLARLPRSLEGLDGRLKVVGTNAVENLAALNWSRSLLQRIEEYLRVPLPDLRLVIDVRWREPVAGKPPEGRILPRYGGTELRCIIENAEAIPMERKVEELCRLVLEGYELERRAERPAAEEFVPRVPLWLSVGLLENLDVDRRAANGDLAIRTWRQGGLPGVGEILQWRTAADRVVAMRSEDRAACMLLVDWLVAQPEGAAVEAAFQLLAAGEEITAARLVDFPGFGRDLDLAWDQWVLARKRYLLTPGQATAGAADLLREQLLISPADLGISPGEGSHQAVALTELTDFRAAPGFDGMCRNKAAAVRLLAVGRGHEFAEVAELYAAFFEAARIGRRDYHVQRMLRKAEARLAELENGDDKEEDDRRND